MANKTLKEVFDEQFSHVVFDAAFCRRVVNYSQHFMTRNQDHTEFFGGVLLGVNPIRFFEADRENWYDDVLTIDETLLLEDFKNVKEINFEFKVMSDAFNYTAAYVTHRLELETQLPKQLRKDAQVHAFMVLHYRFLTSLLVPRFRYPADPEIAQAAYNSLDLKWHIRKYGSWRALLLARCDELTSPNSIYYKFIRAFSPDPSIIRVVTDTQGRIREVINKLYQVYLTTRDSGIRVKSTSSTFISTDGETILRDKTHGYPTYIRYIREVAQSERSFIRDELIDVISAVVKSVRPQQLRESLAFISLNIGHRKFEYLDELLTENMVYVFDFLQTNKALLGNNMDLAVVMARLRNLYTASRSSDPQIIRLRQLGDRVVKEAIKQRNESVISSTRTAVLLYIILRTLTKQHYS